MDCDVYGIVFREGLLSGNDTVYLVCEKLGMTSLGVTCWVCVLGICVAVCGLAHADGLAASFTPTVIQVKTSETHHRNRTVETTERIQSRHISIVGDNFMMDGQPLHIMSGSLHYFRVPAIYWKDRLHKLKAAGFNSVATYVEWSFHEPEERQYSFEGDRDVAAFVRMAAEEGLHVLLRPGPYICAERDLGGLPYWLLGKYQNIRLRSTDEDFMAETKTWMKKLFSHLRPLLFGNGGPIILVQVENEYGSYGSDMEYKTQMRDVIKDHVGDSALLYTTDGTNDALFRGGAIPDTLTTIDFGPTRNNARDVFNPLRRFMPLGPLMNSEYYPGWLTHWGESLQQVAVDSVVATLEDMLEQAINVNVYVFFGGTNYEFTSGANYISTYVPDITSYDYDAPLNEAGDPTPKYFAIREAIAKHYPQVKNIDPPTPSNKGAYGTISLSHHFGLLSPKGRSSLGKKYPNVVGSTLPTFEKLRQRSGLMLYETTVGETSGLLQILQPRDRVYVYINGEYQGVISRTYKIHSVPLITEANSILSLLVENQGRINYGPYLQDYKGILSEVIYDGKVLNSIWTVTGFPLENLDAISSISDEQAGTDISPAQGPVLSEGYFTIPENQEPLDTFLDPTGWGKGYIWVNGHNLGRYWPGLGPQVTLFVPGCWLRAAPARNHVQLLELEEVPRARNLVSIDYPILNRTAAYLTRTNISLHEYLSRTLT